MYNLGSALQVKHHEEPKIPQFYKTLYWNWDKTM